MLKGLDMKQRLSFTSEFDTEDPKTIFVMRPLTGEEQENFKDMAGNQMKLSGTKIYDFLSTGIVEIKNFDIEGDIRTQLNSITDGRVLAELITALGRLSMMTKEDKKNS